MNKEQTIKALAEFLVEHQVEQGGGTKLMATALNEAKERFECGDFKVRAQNSHDGKEHIFVPSAAAI